MAVDKSLGYEYFMDKSHPLATKTGRVYTHRHVMMLKLGRVISSDEYVHHIDENKLNNNEDNLVIMSPKDHAHLHNGEKKELQCKSCGKTFRANSKKKYYCSTDCSNVGMRKVERPSKEELSEMIDSMSWVAIGRKYGVSDNAIRKWAKAYGII